MNITGTVVDVIHVVHEHVAVRAIVAADVREAGHTGVGAALVRGVGHIVSTAAAVAVVAPDMVQVEPVADLVRRGAAQVERRRDAADRAESGTQDHHAIGLRRTAGELRIAEQAATQLANPDVQVTCSRPGIHAAAGGCLDRVVVGKAGDRGLAPFDARGGRTVRRAVCQVELDARIRSQGQEWRRRAGDIRIGATKVAVQDIDLAADLRIGDVLGRRIPDHVHHDRNTGDAGTLGFAIAGSEQRRLVFDFGATLRIAGVGRQQATVHVHRRAASDRTDAAVCAVATVAVATVAVAFATATSPITGVAATRSTSAHVATRHAVIL